MKKDDIIQLLRQDAGAHAWALQDLQFWPDDTTIHVRHDGGVLNYLLFTGHPGARRVRSAALGGTPAGVEPLLEHLGGAPLLIRETPASLLPVLMAKMPHARVWQEQRMEATRQSFKPCHKGKARRVTAADAATFAAFHGAPPQAIPQLLPWIEGAIILGVFDGPRLDAMASTFVRVPEVWDLVSIRTRPEARRRGLAAEVTSALTALALEAAPLVTLTVLKDNAPALALYGKLGFAPREDRIWLDHGAGSTPQMT